MLSRLRLLRGGNVQLARLPEGCNRREYLA